MVHSEHSGPNTGRTPEEVPGDGESGRSFVSILALLIRRRGLLLGLPLGVFVVSILLSFLMPARFTAQSRFLPETDREMPGELAGLAAQMGVGPGAAATSGESLDFYGQLIRSHELLTEVIRTDYVVPIDEGRDTIRGDLIALYEIDGTTPEERLKSAKQLLEERYVSVSPYRNANILVLRTVAPWPDLAEEVNRRILTLVNEFNLGRRQTRAAQERDFLEGRLEQVRSELREAEEELQRFVEGNRRYSEAPETALQYARLQRRIRFGEQSYSSVVQALEQAEVEAIRNMPVITVVDRPEGTALQTAPEPLVNGLLGLLLGGGIAVAIVLGGELLNGARRSSPKEYAELQGALEEVMSGLPFSRRKVRRSKTVAVRKGASVEGERERPVAASMGATER